MSRPGGALKELLKKQTHDMAVATSHPGSLRVRGFPGFEVYNGAPENVTHVSLIHTEIAAHDLYATIKDIQNPKDPIQGKPSYPPCFVSSAAASAPTTQG